MFAIVGIAASAAISANGYGVTYGPGAGGFNELGLHEGIQVGGAGYYWQPKPSSDLMSVAKERRVLSANSCSGNYIGADCSERVCPFGLSANTSPFLKNGLTGSAHTDDGIYAPTSRIERCTLVDGSCDDAEFIGDTNKFLGTHTYEECSGKGTCDRETGICECFNGYTGVGCRYTTCPNDCNGHGLCQQNARANPEYDTEGKLYFGSQYWDAYKTMRCVCDRGYAGVDCADRICPSGDDILTTCLADSVHDVQDIELAFGASLSSYSESSKFFTLTYTDGFNGMYSTRPIPILDDVVATASQTQIALETLPNDALPSVQVSGVVDGNTHTLSVTFSDQGSSGVQKDLGCSVRYMDEICGAGQSPMIDSGLTTADLTCTNLGHKETDPSMFEENEECGNRGVCDKTTGKCDCFDGHTGAACDIYSVYV